MIVSAILSNMGKDRYKLTPSEKKTVKHCLKKKQTIFDTYHMTCLLQGNRGDYCYYKAARGLCGIKSR